MQKYGQPAKKRCPKTFRVMLATIECGKHHIFLCALRSIKLVFPFIYIPLQPTCTNHESKYLIFYYLILQAGLIR